jgi:phosphocarrier protein
MTEVSRKVALCNRHGLHARPSTEFVRQANGFRSIVEVEVRGQKVNGKSVIEMMTLGAPVGTELLITTRGEDAEAALQALVNLVLARFGEKE